LAKLSLMVKAGRKPKFSSRGYHRCRRVAGGALNMRKFQLCASVSGNWPRWGRFREWSRQAGKGQHHYESDRSHGDMLTRMRNATMPGPRRWNCRIPGSRTALPVFSSGKALSRIIPPRAGPRKVLRLYMKFGPGRENVIRGLQRVSKPGLRRYVSADALRPIKSGTGLAIVSTSRA